MDHETVRKSIRATHKGQVALESLLIVSFLLLLLIPMVVYVLGTLSSESWKLDAQQANVAARRIVTLSNRLALGGEGTFTTEYVFIPSSVTEMKTSGREVTFVIDGKEFGFIDQAAVADVPMVLDPAGNWTDIRGMNVFVMNITNGTVLISQS